MNKFIHVRSPKFPVLPGEKEELINEGMYGRALAEYLQAKLQERGYEAPFVCCEDWGWWVELKNAPFKFGAAIYCGPETKGPRDLFSTDGVPAPKKWSWSKFRWIDTSPWTKKLHEDMVAIFRSDPEVELVNTSLDEPFPAAK
jgi:hypothetical protein